MDFVRLSPDLRVAGPQLAFWCHRATKNSIAINSSFAALDRQYLYATREYRSAVEYIGVQACPKDSDRDLSGSSRTNERKGSLTRLDCRQHLTKMNNGMNNTNVLLTFSGYLGTFRLAGWDFGSLGMVT